MVGRAVQTVRFLFESKSLPVSRATLGIQQINGAQPSPRVSAHALPTAPGPAGRRRGAGGGLARAQNPPHAPPGRGIDAVLGPVPGHSLGGSGPPPGVSWHPSLPRPPAPHTSSTPSLSPDDSSGPKSSFRAGSRAKQAGGAGSSGCAGAPRWLERPPPVFATSVCPSGWLCVGRRAFRVFHLRRRVGELSAFFYHLQ